MLGRAWPRRCVASCVHGPVPALSLPPSSRLQECKITGSAGFSDELVIGGGEKSIPLIDVDVGYEF